MKTYNSWIEELVQVAQDDLKRDFGTAEHFLNGCGYHNHTHGLDVATNGSLLASILHEAGRVRHEFVSLARFAGWRHDARQGQDHEAHSAAIAAEDMRRHGCFSERDVRTVVKVIHATKVVAIDGYRIVQAADPDDPEQASLADGDLSSLGMRKGVYATLLLGIEQQHLSGASTLASPTDGTDAEPNREAMIKFLRFQFGLYDSHRFMLEISRQLFPHQEANRDEIGRMIDLYEADRLSFSDMFASAKQRAES